MEFMIFMKNQKSIIISSRIDHKKKKELQNQSIQLQLLTSKITWDIYNKYLPKQHTDNLRFIHALRKDVF